MTAVCSGGTSSPRPEVASVVALSSPAIGALLAEIPAPWAITLAATLGLLTYETPTFCAADPPAVPTITAADVVAMLNPQDLTNYLPARAKLQDLVGAYVWYQVCQCDSVATPAPPSPPAAPDVDINPTNLPQPTTSPCSVYDKSLTADFSTEKTIIGTGARTVWTGSVALPPNATSYKMDIDINCPLPWATAVSVTLMAWNALATTITNVREVDFSSSLPGPHQTASVTGALPAGASWIKVTVIGGKATPATDFAEVKVSAFCGGATGDTQAQPCCPPDPILSGQLQQILEYVTLIQRQIAPFAFIDGPAHTALSGDGTVSVSDPLIGIRIDLTSTPGRAGLIVGSPDALFDIGHVSLGDADGWFSTIPIARSSQLWQPRWSGAVTRIGYSLTPGVVATITELRREH